MQFYTILQDDARKAGNEQYEHEEANTIHATWNNLETILLNHQYSTT